MKLDKTDIVNSHELFELTFVVIWSCEGKRYCFEKSLSQAWVEDSLKSPTQTQPGDLPPLALGICMWLILRWESGSKEEGMERLSNLEVAGDW